MTMQIETTESTDESNVCGCGSWEHSSDLSVIRHDIWELRQDVNKFIELVGAIQSQVEPALDAVANSPVGAMFGLRIGGNHA